MALKDSAANLGTLGNYDLLDKLGEGSMGTVYKARHWTTGQIVAIKVMPANIARKPMLLNRFEQEFRIANRVDHPNVVRVLEYSGQPPEPYMVMEFVNGVSVGDRLEREGRLDEADALNVIIQVAEGLHYAHAQGLLHRDVKPDNILVTADGVAKLTDLGLGKEIDAAAELTRTGTGLGTPNFMAPEQFRDAKNADVRCDVYSLGATLYQMATGELPFGQGDPVRILMGKLSNHLVPPRKIVPGLSEQTEHAILRSMDPEPTRRHGTCQEFVDDLLGKISPTPAEKAGPQDAGAQAQDADMAEEDLGKTHLMPKGISERQKFLDEEMSEEDLTKTHIVRRSRNENQRGARQTEVVSRSAIAARLAHAVASAPVDRPEPATLRPEPVAHLPTMPGSSSAATEPMFHLPISQQRLRLSDHAEEQPEPSAAPSAEASPWRSLDSWKTAAVVLLTGLATIALSHLLFFGK